MQLFTNYEWYFIPRLREHVQDATKNPMLIFPEGEQIPLLVHICHPLKFFPSPSWFFLKVPHILFTFYVSVVLGIVVVSPASRPAHESLIGRFAQV